MFPPLALFSSLFLYMTAILAHASEVPSDASEESTPNLAVTVSTSWPNAEIFGVKLVNGRSTQALLSFTNEELKPVVVQFVVGRLMAPDPRTGGETLAVVRNLTTSKYGVTIPAGEKNSVAYNFVTELHPQDLTLDLVATVASDDGGIHTLSAYNETVSIVEPDTSIFDPQILFLYLILASAFLGSLYFVYITWIATLFPQRARGGKGGERAKRSSGGSKKVDPASAVSVVGADGPAVTSGAAAYDESWIPAGHLVRPEARRVKSGASSRSKSRGKSE